MSMKSLTAIKKCYEILSWFKQISYWKKMKDETGGVAIEKLVLVFGRRK